MKHYQIVSHPYRPGYPKYQVTRKSLANPVIDVVCVVALVAVLLMVGYLHI